MLYLLQIKTLKIKRSLAGSFKYLKNSKLVLYKRKHIHLKQIFRRVVRFLKTFQISREVVCNCLLCVNKNANAALIKCSVAVVIFTFWFIIVIA